MNVYKNEQYFLEIFSNLIMNITVEIVNWLSIKCDLKDQVLIKLPSSKERGFPQISSVYDGSIDIKIQYSENNTIEQISNFLNEYDLPIKNISS